MQVSKLSTPGLLSLLPASVRSPLCSSRDVRHSYHAPQHLLRSDTRQLSHQRAPSYVVIPMDFGDYHSHFVLRAEVFVDVANEIAVVVRVDPQFVGTSDTPNGIAISLAAVGLSAPVIRLSGLLLALFSLLIC